jgi:hypothetical protein
MDMRDMPISGGKREPSADARGVARACRDQFLALVAEGFTENQALQIIGVMIAAATHNK